MKEYKEYVYYSPKLNTLHVTNCYKFFYPKTMDVYGTGCLYIGLKPIVSSDVD